MNKSEMVAMSVEAFEALLERLSNPPRAILRDGPGVRLLGIGGDEDAARLVAALLISRAGELVTPDEIRVFNSVDPVSRLRAKGLAARLRKRAEQRERARVARSQIDHAPPPKKQNRKRRP